MKTALITGGTKGIGLGIAHQLIQDGYRIMITSRHGSEANQIAEELNQSHGDKVALGMECDVRDAKAQNQCVEKMLNEWGQIDVVIANAGIGHFASIENMTAEQWNDTIDINLTGVFYTIKSSLEALKKSKGYFITIASLAGTNFFPTGAAYNASKFGLVGFTQAVMLDLRNHGIKVTTIMPGSVSTHFNNHTPGPEDAWKIQPEDLGQMVSDLLKMHPRTLPSKIEVRPSVPKSK